MKTFTIEDQEQIENIIKSCKTCFVGMTDKDGLPYVLPMNFGYEDGVIYLHSAQEGRSIQLMEQNPNICVTFCTEPVLIHQHPEVACSYRMRAGSVICEGKVEFEEEFSEKERALNIIMAQYTPKKFSYGAPAINNVKVWKLKVEKWGAKEFGTMTPGTFAHKS